MSVPARPDRRTFLTTAGATAAALAVGARPGRAQSTDKLRVAIIGVGGRGGAQLKGLSGEQIVAICDVNGENLARAGAMFPQAKQFTDFRRVFDHASEFDAVAVSTAEHTHAFATLPALQLKKHVYCEKPLTYNVHEARVIREAAAKAGVVTQMGTQIHAGDNYRRVVEHIQSGVIGKVTECHVWVSRAWGWHASEAEATAAKDIVFVQDRPTTVDPVPPSLDWDLWLGPAPARPFNSVYLPGPKWYRWWDFGNGTMSDLGSHWIDLPFWALKLKWPSAVEASGPPVNAELAPASMSATYTYEADGDQPALSLTWHQGTSKPAIWTQGGIPKWEGGALFIGDKGMLLADYSKFVLLPEEKWVGYTPPPQSIPPSLGHHQEFIHACKTGAPTTCNFAYSGLLTEANHLGNVAYRVGKKILWDHKGMRITNAPDAERFIKRPSYRQGWTLA
ncbi:Gfo/Idh/MocA family oxidoreductase [Luteitalea sp.]|uniref:Gfo/Idh/MocA family protein n=1 Tax=Luteitalea sp. TaxID=2004800 RepID=UPI0025B8AD72|nr:Gfo/Idh/MocA family oxidoreductase [Luteitalea sp.]